MKAIKAAAVQAAPVGRPASNGLVACPRLAHRCN